MQFKAGYITDSIANIITDKKAKLNKKIVAEKDKLLQINGLLQNVSSFEVDFPFEHKPNYHKLNPVLATINNIITRGLPTRLPVSIEKLFSEIELTEPNKHEFEFNFPNPIKKLDFETIFELLHIIEPHLVINSIKYGGKLGSNLEWNFIKSNPFVCQILESQRDFSTINPLLAGERTVDFSFTSPYLYWDDVKECYKNQARIFEVDGPHHLLTEYKLYDLLRDDLATVEDIETFRFNTEAINNQDYNYENLIGKEIYSIFSKNYNREIKDYLPEYSLLFIPLAVARIQKTIIEFLISNPNEFEKEEIKIAIIERDLPCGSMAIKSLQEMFENINAILEEEDKLILPKIDFSIFENKNWVIDSRLHLDASIKTEEYFKLTNFDIVIDHSILRRSNIYKEIDYNCVFAIIIRSSHYFDTKNGRKIYCANLLNYKSLVEKKDDGSYIPVSEYEKNINFFIQNIFRKVSFRDGQLPIISRALQQKPVIGLLPTGGGKSLTFQLPTFLQPGLCLVVDPIKSLMEDQVRVLKQNWIDCCDFINSNLSRQEKLKKLIDFRFGETMFLFVSPERFVMEDFRNIISKIDIYKFGLVFSYCVIDEVHCVSEWGHDFRSTYLMLGKNAQRFATTKSKKPVSLIGLTATASFDVLADIERELQIKHDDVADAIIMIENTIRPELFFRIIDVTGKNRIDELNKDFQNIGKNLSKINNEKTLLLSQMHHFNEFGKKDFATVETKNLLDESKMEFEYNPRYLIKNSLENISQNEFYSIVFCPVKGETKRFNGEWANENGVNFVHEKLNSNSKGFFYASDNQDLSTEVQDHFEKFTTDKTQHIVCTKAFGMGIDKKDIRSTYHYVYSGSLESLVQEAGRSGRDKKISEANILISKTEIITIDYKCLLMVIEEDKSNNPIKDTFHRSQIRRLIDKEFFTIEDCNTAILNSVNNLKKWVGGNQEELSDDERNILIKRCQNFIKINYQDRNIHNFFHQGSFKGVDTEISQFYSLFREKEFIITSKLRELNDEFNIENNVEYLFKFWTNGVHKRLYISDYDENDLGYINLSLPLDVPTNIILLTIFTFLKKKNEGKEGVFNLFTEEIIDNTLNEGTFIEVYNNCDTDEFKFTLASEKIFPDNFNTIYKKLSEIEEQYTIQNNQLNLLNTLYTKATKFEDLILETTGKYQKIGFKWCSFQTDFDDKYISKIKEAFENKININDLLILFYEIQIEKSFKKSNGSFLNFLLLLEENIDKLKFSFDKENSIERWLKLYFNRSRHFKPTNDTGRLIYRMNCIGLLTDYEIDYNKNNLYNCTFSKLKSIEDYLLIISNYFKRYLSENTANETIEKLNERLKSKDVLTDKLLECLYFLAEFSDKEIASKRTRATDEIESILNKSVTDEAYTKNWYEQNIYIKEQIYFYFNAKYARIGYKINGEAFSLLDDYQSNAINKVEILNKYLGTNLQKGVFQLEGTEQNNYKHMMGSCKKILRSLSESDLNNEWLLRLLKAFSMYAVNNPSYISEANAELELGFINLYKDKNFHYNDFEIIEPIFESYFEILRKNITPENPSFKDIKEIRKKLLFIMQADGIEKLITKNQELIAKYYA